MHDDIDIEILEDGTIKTSTNLVSMPNHSNAESFLKDMARLAGGETLRKKNPKAQGHTHIHGHETHGH